MPILYKEKIDKATRDGKKEELGERGSAKSESFDAVQKRNMVNQFYIFLLSI
jgi:hypothetical protein